MIFSRRRIQISIENSCLLQLSFLFILSKNDKILTHTKCMPCQLSIIHGRVVDFVRVLRRIAQRRVLHRILHRVLLTHANIVLTSQRSFQIKFWR